MINESYVQEEIKSKLKSGNACHGNRCIQKEEESFYQQIELKFEEETSEMLVWSMALYGSETWTLRP